MNKLIITNVSSVKCFKGGGGGGGGVGGHPVLFVKFYFEIAVDQQTKAYDQTF